MRRFRTILVASLVLLLGVAGGAFLFMHHPVSVKYDPLDPAYNRTFWKEEVSQKGAKAAYEEFKERTAKLPANRQHFAAHVIGGVIGEALGPSGISVCDASFGFGCYHGLFSEVIATGGTTLVKQLDHACVAAYGNLGTGCQHGIGHGILEYVGYDQVNTALALCKDTTQVVPLLGCTSGVFMEYFFPLSGPPDALVTSQRPLDPAHPYMPCTTVPAENRDSCYYELGSWLRTIAPDAHAAGKTCDGLTGSLRQDCFLGIGTLAMQIDGNDLAKARTECATLSSGDELSCRAGVRWALFELPERRATAASACGYTDPAEENACERLGDLTRGLDPLE